MTSSSAATVALMLLGGSGWALAIVQHPRAAPCPAGYEAVFRSDLTAACAAYVVEPVK